jgi:hypothetical protein
MSAPLVPVEAAPTEPPPPSLPSAVASIGARLLLLALAQAVVGPLWLPYLALRAAMGRPPVVPELGRLVDFVLAAMSPAPAPGRPLSVRLMVLLSLLVRIVILPLPGLAWLLDELLEGRAFDAVKLRAPILEISAARSGSTQLARSIEADPRVCAPSLVQILLPYRWLWRLQRRFAPGLLEPSRLLAFVHARVPPAYLARHELDPSKTDSFEVAFMGHQLGDLAQHLGPGLLLSSFSPSPLGGPNAGYWSGDFLRFLERISQKTLLDANCSHGERQIFIKGHFLAAAPALAERFPDARFLTVLRDPMRRLQSVVNFHRAQPGEPDLPPLPWPWIVEQAVEMELAYAENERLWFGAAAGPVRCLLPFDRFVDDLPGAMSHVYGVIFDDAELPASLDLSHPARERGRYPINHSLEALGISTAVLAQRFAPYVAWMRAVRAAQAEAAGVSGD